MRCNRIVAVTATLIVALFTYLPIQAQTPACGTTITTPGTTITFDSDMVCPAGFTGTAMTIQADNVNVDGAGFGIVAPEAGTVIGVSSSEGMSLSNLNLSGNPSADIALSLVYVTNSTISNINAPGTTGLGSGIQSYYGGGNLYTNNTVTGWRYGINILQEQDNTISDNILTDNDYYGIAVGAAGSGFIITDNDLSRSGSSGLKYSGTPPATLGVNDLTDCPYGLNFSSVDGLILSGFDFTPYNITNIPLVLTYVTNSTISNINASGTAGLGSGIQSYYGGGNLFNNNTVTGRRYGINILQEHNNTISDNILTDNDYYGITVGAAGSGFIITDNDLSRSGSSGLKYSGTPPATLGVNDLTDCPYGLNFSSVDGLILSGFDFTPYNITNIPLVLTYVTNSTISNINASGTAGLGSGIQSYYGGGNLFNNNTVTGRRYGINILQEHDNTISDNILNDNDYYGITVGAAGSGFIITDNDLSRSGSSGLKYSGTPPATLGVNDLTDCPYGLNFSSVDGLILSGFDFTPYNITNIPLVLTYVTNSTISNINASGTEGLGSGIQSYYGGGNLYTNNTVTGRQYGLNFLQEYDDTITNNILTDNSYYGVTIGAAGSGFVITDNDLSRSGSAGLKFSGAPPATLGVNDLTDCPNGLNFSSVDGLNISGFDFTPYNIPGVPLQLTYITNSTISNINASGTGGLGTGIKAYYGGGNLFSNNTVTGRKYGIYFLAEHDDTVLDNVLTDNATNGIAAFSLGQGTMLVNNDVSRAGSAGISVTGESVVIRGNTSVDSGYGVLVTGPSSGLIIANNLVTGSSLSGGIRMTWQSLAEVRNNTVTGGEGDGLVLLSSSDTKIYHNNIYGNAGWQVTSDTPIELSYGNEGNFWGRSCDDDPFLGLCVAGEDSNVFDVADSFAYGVENAWDQDVDPGCGPPPPGWIIGEVWDGVGPVSGVDITLEDSGQNPLYSTATDGFGEYGFEALEPGIYFTSMIVPIGYAPDSPTQQEAIVNSDEETRVDFSLERLVVEVDTRGMGYWKHQAKAHVTGKGRAHEEADAMLEYLAAIQADYDAFDDVIGMEGLLGVLEPPKPATMQERAEQHLMTLVLNLSSLRIATYTEVSTDDTCGEAIDLIIAVLNESGSAKDELEAAKDLAEDINEGRLPLDPERIPEPVEEGE